MHKKSSSSIQPKTSWKTVLDKFVMMPNPHCENGSQGYFTLERKDFTRSLNSVSSLRFILYQPSPNWKMFTLEELYIYPISTSDSSSESIPRWLLESPDVDDSDTAIVDEAKFAGLPDPNEASKHLVEMLRLAEKVQEFQPTSELGRFDVDGCYEVNLLSYT